MFNLLANNARRSRLASVVSSRTNIKIKFQTPLALGSQRLLSDAEGQSKLTGTVKWFNSEKGYGFITPADGSTDVFVHHTAIHASGFRSLGDGESVEYEVIEEPNGKLKAIQVTGPDGSYVQGAPKRFSNDGYGADGYGGGGGGGYNDGGGFGGGGGGY